MTNGVLRSFRDNGSKGMPRTPSTRDILKDAVDATYNALMAQKAFLRDEEFYISNDGVNFNHKALGYILGFFNVSLRKLGLDIKDDVGPTITLHLLTRLFPKEAHKTKTYVVYLKHNMTRDPKVLNGMQFGGQEALDYFEKRKPAMGLVFCLSEHD
jgi:hypothetical protein